MKILELAAFAIGSNVFQAGRPAAKREASRTSLE
jgi:hypothetical protein